MAFPTSLTNAVDGATEIIAAHINNLEAKSGINNSAVTSSLDYMVRHPRALSDIGIQMVSGGSILIFPRAYGDGVDARTSETYIYFDPGASLGGVMLHVFFVSDGGVADSFSHVVGITRLALSQWDPGYVDQIIAIPVAMDGQPFSGPIEIRGWIEYQDSASNNVVVPALHVKGSMPYSVSPSVVTLNFDGTDYDALPTKLSFDGFRNATERDAIKISLSRVDMDMFSAPNNLGTLTITQVDSGGNTTWTKSVASSLFFGTLADLDAPTLPPPSDANTKITIEAPTGAYIVGTVHGSKSVGINAINGKLMKIETTNTGCQITNFLVSDATPYLAYFGWQGPVALGTLATSLVGVGLDAPSAAKFEVRSATLPQLRLDYDELNYADFQVDSAGKLSISALASLTLVDYGEKVNALGSCSGATTINLILGNVVTALAGGAVTWSFTNPKPSGTCSSFALELQNGGAFAQTWPASVKWPGGTAPTLTASGYDVLAFFTVNSGTTWRGVLAQANSM